MAFRTLVDMHWESNSVTSIDFENNKAINKEIKSNEDIKTNKTVITLTIQFDKNQATHNDTNTKTSKNITKRKVITWNYTKPW